MNRMFFVATMLLIVGGWAQDSLAYFVAIEPAQLRAGVATDVFVAGFGNEQGSQFLKSAILSAKVSRDRFPQRQRVIISAVSESLGAERNMLSAAGFSFKKANQDKLTKERVVSVLQSLKAPVSSLQFYGHANTSNGFRLQSKKDRLDQRDKEFAQMGTFLAPNAFVAFYSCNSGWHLAPAAARLMRRPAFGSLTSSDFQEMMSDGKWYHHNPWNYPSHLSRIGSTSHITHKSLDCGPYQCMRLTPVNSSYDSDFGKFDKGLGFYKVFSPDDNLVPQALIHFTLLTPTVTPLSMQSSRQDFEKAVSDWMCPADKNGKLREACVRAIETKSFLKNPRLSFYSGTPVSCTNQSCYTTVKCKPLKAIFGRHPCRTVELNSKVPSTVFSDQLRMFSKGLDLLEQGRIDL